MKTKVKFLIENPEGDLPCNVFAFFPDDRHNNSEPTLFTSYAHFGQHSACCLEYANECREAKYNEYKDLLKELIEIGYNNLQIMNKQEIEAHRPPTKGELKFGEGAIHWLTVDLPNILNKRGDIKKWFVWPGDNLRYSTR